MSEWALTALVSGLALAAVWLPLHRGMRLCFQARRATRSLDARELKHLAERRSAGGVSDEPLALLMLRTLRRSLDENQAGHPRDFVVDAVRQIVLNEYDMRFARRISMYANLLPPIGFIGTTGGLLVLFVSMHLADSALELGALAIALTSSIFALVGFALLEGVKLRLYSRLLVCVDEGIALQRRAEERRAA